jgi:acyl-coenzyme A synthetase/AMP-(fatty) acid ligase
MSACFPDWVASAIEQERISHLLVTTTALRLLFEGGALDRRDLRSLRRINFFGEPLPLPLLRKIMAILPEPNSSTSRARPRPTGW